MNTIASILFTIALLYATAWSVGLELSMFQWYRRRRRGRWAKLQGRIAGYRWVRVTDQCRERIDEQY